MIQEGSTARCCLLCYISPLKKYPTNLDNLSIEPDFTECYNILVKKDDVKRRKVK